MSLFTFQIIPESHTEVKVEESYSSSGKLNEDEMEAVLEEYLREVRDQDVKFCIFGHWGHLIAQEH